MTLPDRYWTACIMWRDGDVTFIETPFETALLAAFAADDMMLTHDRAEEFAIFDCTRHRGEAWMSENVTEDVLAVMNRKREYYDHILPTRRERIERSIAGAIADAEARQHQCYERMAL